MRWAGLILLLLAAGPAAAAPRIADLWYAHNEITVMLDAAGDIAVTVAKPQNFPWMYRMAPDLRRAVVVASGAPNAEALLAARVNLAFVSQPAEVAPLAALGIAAKDVGFTDVASLLACIHTTADAIGTPVAQARAADYSAYLQARIAAMGKILQATPVASRPRVLHLESLNPLRADGDGTIIDQWIQIAGGRNAADGLHGNMQAVSLEQIASWHPDIIIVAGDAGPLPARSGIWHDLPAIQNNRVFRDPVGVFPWDRYGTEFALQLLWAGKIFHPTLFAQTDMTTQTIAFYQRFFGAILTPLDAERILAAQPPA
jgi:iron complex transport system substrate-binding protein